MEDKVFKKFQTFLATYHINLFLITKPDCGTIVGEFAVPNGGTIYSYTVETRNSNINEGSYLRKLDQYAMALDRACVLDYIMEEVYRELPKEMKNDDLDDNGIKPKEEFTVREMTLDEAKKCILGNREQDYGSPEDNFTTIAKFWSDYLDKDISAQNVADMMILMKISRIKNGGGTGDSYVDIAGYAACGNEILSKTHK